MEASSATLRALLVVTGGWTRSVNCRRRWRLRPIGQAKQPKVVHFIEPDEGRVERYFFHPPLS